MALVTSLNYKILSRTLLVSVGITALFACSNKPSKSQLAHTDLATRISDSGLKHFELRYGRKFAQQNENGRHPSFRLYTQSGQNYERLLKTLNELAAARLEESGYCKAGFWVLESDIDTRGAYLRGECNDLATAQDRQSFPDSITVW